MKALIALMRVGLELIGKQIHKLQTAAHENYICICKDYAIMQIFARENQTHTKNNIYKKSKSGSLMYSRYGVWAGEKKGENICLITA